MIDGEQQRTERAQVMGPPPGIVTTVVLAAAAGFVLVELGVSVVDVLSTLPLLFAYGVLGILVASALGGRDPLSFAQPIVVVLWPVFLMLLVGSIMVETVRRGVE